MTAVITAVYENGLLRPLEPLHLKEQQRVLIQLLPESSDGEVEQAIRELVNNGSLTLPLGQSDVPPLSETERQELATRLGQATANPLSETIIEERGEW